MGLVAVMGMWLVPSMEEEIVGLSDEVCFGFFMWRDCLVCFGSDS